MGTGCKTDVNKHGCQKKLSYFILAAISAIVYDILRIQSTEAMQNFKSYEGCVGQLQYILKIELNSLCTSL